MKIIVPLILLLLLIVVILLIKSKFNEYTIDNTLPENPEEDDSLLNEDSSLNNQNNQNNENNNQNSPLSDSDPGSESNNLIYIFYATWCGYCKRSMDVFEKLNENFDNVKLIDTDDSKNKSLMTKYSVKTFPTIIASSGKKYSGERTFGSMSDFVNQNK